MPYQGFAQVYDKLMISAPYNAWIKWLKTILNKESFFNPDILEAGCGTGTILTLLSEDGYQIDGLDLSEDMLAIASNKLREKGMTHSLLTCQDMRDFHIPKQYDVILSLCDSINYLNDKVEVQKALQSFYSHLNEGGLLIFDAHSLYYMNQVLTGVSITDASEDISYIWDVYSTDIPGAVEHELTLFIHRQGNLYERHDELHYQRTFSANEYRAMLMNSGFAIKGVYADFTLTAPEQNSERLFFVAEKVLQPANEEIE